MRRLTVITVLLLAGSSLAGCVVPENMGALREELGYASVERPDLVVKARASTLTPTIGEPVNLTADVTGLPLRAVEVSWTVNETTYEGPTTKLAFDEPGTRTVHVQAVGPNGTKAQDEIELDVRPNTPPVPELVVEDRKQLTTEQPVVLRATGSTDPDGDELSFDWTLDGEPIEAGPRLERTLAAGPHAVELRVSDGLVERTVHEAFAVAQPVHHEVTLGLERTSAQFTLGVGPSAKQLDVRLNHSTHAGIDDVNLTLLGPEGTVVARSDTSPEPGESRGQETLSVDGDQLAPRAHTLQVELARGTEATVTVEGVLMYSPLPLDST